MPKRREFEEVQIPTSAMTPPKQQTTAMSESVIASFYSSANQSQMDSYAKFVQQAAELQAAQSAANDPRITAFPANSTANESVAQSSGDPLKPKLAACTLPLNTKMQLGLPV